MPAVCPAGPEPMMRTLRTPAWLGSGAEDMLNEFPNIGQVAWVVDTPSGPDQLFPSHRKSPGRPRSGLRDRRRSRAQNPNDAPTLMTSMELVMVPRFTDQGVRYCW